MSCPVSNAFCAWNGLKITSAVFRALSPMCLALIGLLSWRLPLRLPGRPTPRLSPAYSETMLIGTQTFDKFAGVIFLLILTLLVRSARSPRKLSLFLSIYLRADAALVISMTIFWAGRSAWTSSSSYSLWTQPLTRTWVILPCALAVGLLWLSSTPVGWWQLPSQAALARRGRRLVSLLHPLAFLRLLGRDLCAPWIESTASRTSPTRSSNSAG